MEQNWQQADSYVRYLRNPIELTHEKFHEDSQVSSSASAIENLLHRSRSRKPSLHKDRRGAKRYRTDLAARFRIYLPSRPERCSAHIPAQIIDLSKSGIGLLTDTVECAGLHIMHPWPATSEQCLLEVEILHGETPLTLHGRVAWYSQEEDRKPFGFRAGIQLLDLTAEMKERIRELIDLKESRDDISPKKPE